MASSSRRHTRSNPDPDFYEPVDDLENILRFRKQSHNSQSPVLERSFSLESEPVKTVDGIKFDLKLEQSLFRSKSDSDLSEVVIDIPSLNTFIPKDCSGFSKKEKYIFWHSLSDEVKENFNLLEENKDRDHFLFFLQKELAKLSKDSQSTSVASTSVVSSATQSVVNISQGLSSTTLRAMANRYAPLHLPNLLHPMLADYQSKIKQFGKDGDNTAQQHVDWL